MPAADVPQAAYLGPGSLLRVCRDDLLALCHNQLEALASCAPCIHMGADFSHTSHKQAVLDLGGAHQHQAGELIQASHDVGFRLCFMTTFRSWWNRPKNNIRVAQIELQLTAFHFSLLTCLTTVNVHVSFAQSDAQTCIHWRSSYVTLTGRDLFLFLLDPSTSLPDPDSSL